MDVDGTVSPVHPTPKTLPWGDEVVAGNVFGPVLVSPTLTARLDALHRRPGVTCWWLTSWTASMRARMQPFPGVDWPSIADFDQVPSRDPSWWKLDALDTWLERHPHVRALAWCDDDLRGGRLPAARRRFARRGIESFFTLIPKTTVGLAPEDLERLVHWVETTDTASA